MGLSRKREVQRPKTAFRVGRQHAADELITIPRRTQNSRASATRTKLYRFGQRIAMKTLVPAPQHVTMPMRRSLGFRNKHKGAYQKTLSTGKFAPGLVAATTIAHAVTTNSDTSTRRRLNRPRGVFPPDVSAIPLMRMACMWASAALDPSVRREAPGCGPRSDRVATPACR